jgi:hypothetical protein
MTTSNPCVALFALAVGAITAGPLVPVAAAQTDATAIVAEARKALGGVQKIDGVQTFGLEGSFRRMMGPRQMEGSVEVIAQRPDRMRRIEDLAIGGMSGGPTIERIMTLNGDRGWDESNQRGGGGGGMFQMRMGGPPPGGPGGPRGEGGEPPSPEQIEKFRGRMLRQELDRWMFAFFVSSSQPIAHVGTAQAPDGTADVLEIKDDRGQPVRLFIDQQTHLPLMLQYQTQRPRIVTVGGPAGGPGGPGAAGRPGQAPPAAAGSPGQAGQAATGDGQRPDPEAIRRQIDAQGPPPPVTATMRLSDYRTVSGVLLPHRIEQSIGDDPTEELIIEKFRINPSVKADLFEKK